MVPLYTGGHCGFPYCRLCLAQNSAKCIPYLPSHFEKMCSVCHLYYLNHVKKPIDSGLSFKLQTLKPTDPFPAIRYKASNPCPITILTNAQSPSPPPRSRKKEKPPSNDTRCSSRIAKRSTDDKNISKNLAIDIKSTRDKAALKKAAAAKTKADKERRRRENAVALRRATVST